MTDLIQVLPDLDTKSYTHILPSLEKALITTNDLITLDAADVAKRAQVPPNEVRRLAGDITNAIHIRLGLIEDDNELLSLPGSPDSDGQGQLGSRSKEWQTISTLDVSLDAALGGGFPVGYVTEITGESAAGKTQLLLSLLLAVQLPAPLGLDKSALYISTEAPLSTKRLSQILAQHPRLTSLPLSEKPSLSRVQSTQLHDLESQEHILRYQVPVQIERSNIGLVIVDSVAANFRAEFESSKTKKSVEALSQRSAQLAKLGALLRDIARTKDVAIVVANQVLDRFAPAATLMEQASALSQRSISTQLDGPGSASGRSTPLGRQASTSLAPAALETQIPLLLSTNDPLSLDHQQRFFTGWGDHPHSHKDLKTPSLGLTWTNQVSARIVLLKEPILKPQDYVLGPGMDIVGWNRWIKVAFSSWCRDHNGDKGLPFEIWEGGIRGKNDRVVDDSIRE
ncbi:hypothetical protein AAFC00_005293 [Neodothiora populina]|uniref:RecA family profile 1 domain-containing protein n=1 Tax=Neodothiora populina TaxID=2781224 RepID=A0ABR3PKE9_9PEZI